MKSFPRLLIAALLSAIPLCPALAQQLLHGVANGVDYSVNAPSLAGLSLLATIPDSAGKRQGYLIEAQCTAGLTVVFDDGAALLTPSILVLAGPSAPGGQGGSVTMAGAPHTGRVRIYSSSSSCQMAARAW